MATVGAFLNSRNAKLYLAFRPDSHFDFDRFPQFAEFFQFFSRGEGKANCGDLPRLYLLLLNIARVMREKVPGDLAEIGVYQGNTARILAEAARSSGRHLYLFDTFEGFHSQDLRGPDRTGVPGHFGDTSLETVKAFVGTHGVEYIVGRFPESLTQRPIPQQFSIVHLDCDLHDPMLAGLTFFYPRLSPGGLLILHDYSSGHWSGGCQAIDAFMADNKWECRLNVKAHFGTVIAGPYAGRFDVLGKNVNAAAMLDSPGVALSVDAFRKLSPERRKRFKKHTAPVTYIRLEDPHRLRRR